MGKVILSPLLTETGIQVSLVAKNISIPLDKRKQMVLDNKSTVTISFASTVWLVCTFISIFTYLGEIDIGVIGIITWIVFLGGIGYLILKAIDELT